MTSGNTQAHRVVFNVRNSVSMCMRVCLAHSGEQHCFGGTCIDDLIMRGVLVRWVDLDVGCGMLGVGCRVQRSRQRAKTTEQDIKREREQQHRDSCTFHPAINPKSIKLAQHVVRPSGT